MNVGDKVKFIRCNGESVFGIIKSLIPEKESALVEMRSGDFHIYPIAQLEVITPMEAEEAERRAKHMWSSTIVEPFAASTILNSSMLDDESIDWIKKNAVMVFQLTNHKYDKPDGYIVDMSENYASQPNQLKLFFLKCEGKFLKVWV